jgi:hypothetical protein
MVTEDGKANIKEVKEFFGMTMEEMREEWKDLSKEDQEYFKTAVGEFITKSV